MNGVLESTCDITNSNGNAKSPSSEQSGSTIVVSSGSGTSGGSEDSTSRSEAPNGRDGDPKDDSDVVSPRSRSSEDSVDALAFNLPGYQSHLTHIGGFSGAYHEDLLRVVTARDSNLYDLTLGTKLVIVFNQESFIKKDFPKRKGTENDCAVIKATFEGLGFRVDIYDDLTMNNIRNVIHKLQGRGSEVLSCLFIFILTHGEENGTLHAYDQSYRLDREIINSITPEFCPNLAGKPKIVIVQACAGKTADDGFTMAPRSRSRHTSTDSSASSYKIPHFADFFIFQASYHGHYSFRGSSGSWLVQSFCKFLENSSEKESFHDIVLQTKRYVALYKESNVPDNPFLDKKKQIPLVQDTLIRSIYLKQDKFQLDQNELNSEEECFESRIPPKEKDRDEIEVSKNKNVWLPSINAIKRIFQKK